MISMLDIIFTEMACQMYAFFKRLLDIFSSVMQKRHSWIFLDRNKKKLPNKIVYLATEHLSTADNNRSNITDNYSVSDQRPYDM